MPMACGFGQYFQTSAANNIYLFLFRTNFPVNDTNKRNAKKQKHEISRILMYLYFDLFRNFSSVSLTNPSGRNNASIIGITWSLVVNIFFLIFI